MKTFKIAFASFTLALVAFASLLVTSCQKETLYPPIDESVLFTKDITVTDRSGKNSAVIRLSSANESALTAVDYSKVIEIEPIFEAPTAENAEVQALQEDVADDNSGGINLEIVSQQLEKGAIGLKMKFNEDSENTVQDRVVLPAPVTLIVPQNNFLIVGVVGCHKVKYSKKVTSSSDWTEIGTTPRICPGEFSIIGPISSYRLRAAITKVSSSTVTADVYWW